MRRINWSLNAVDPSLFELVQTPCVVFNERGDIIFANSASESFFHVPMEVLETQALFSFIDINSRIAIEKLIQSQDLLEFETLSLTFTLQNSTKKCQVKVNQVHADEALRFFLLVVESGEEPDKQAGFFQEVQILQERKLLRNIIELNPYAIAIFDPEGYLLHGNSAYFRLFGDNSPQEYCFYTDSVLNASPYMDEALDAMKQGIPFVIPQIKYPISQNDDEGARQERWLSISIFALFDSDNFLWYPIFMYEDITAQVEQEAETVQHRQKLEKEVKQRSQTLQKIVQLNPYAIAIFDKRGRLLDANRVFHQIFQVGRSGNFSLFQTPIMAKFAVSDKLPLLENGENVNIKQMSMDLSEFHPDIKSHMLTVEGVVFPIKTEEGTIDRIILMLEDKTMEMQAEASLAFERTQLMSIFDSFPELIFVYSLDTQETLYANTKLKNFSISLGNVDQIIYDFMVHITPNMEEPPNKTEIRPKTYRFEFYHKILQRYYLVSSRFIRWQDEKVVILVFAIDISDKVKNEMALKQQIVFRGILTEISAKFVQSYNLDKVIDESFREIAKHLKCEEISLFQCENKDVVSKAGNISNEDGPNSQMIRFELKNKWGRFIKGTAEMVDLGFTIPKASPFYDVLRQEEWMTFKYFRDNPIYPLSFQNVFAETSNSFSVFFPIKYQQNLSGLLLFRFEAPIANQAIYQILKAYADILANVLEREKAETFLAKERMTLQNIIEHNPFGIAIFDGKGNFVSANAALKKFLAFIPPEKYNLFRDPLLSKRGYLPTLQGLKHGQNVQIALLCIHSEEKSFFPNDTDFYMKFVAFPILDSKKNLEEIVVMVENLTGETLAKQALKTSEIKYMNLFQNSSIGIGITDLKGRIQELNNPMLELLGCSQEDIHKIDVRTLYWDRSDREKMFQIIEEKGKVDNVPVKFKNYHGEPYWALLSIQPFKMAERDLLFVTLIDISEKYEAEQRVREQEARYRSLIESSNDIIWEIDSKGVFTYISEKSKEVLGIPPEDIVGHGIEVLPLDEDQKSNLKGELSQKLRQLRDEAHKKVTFQNILIKTQNKQGQQVILETNGTSIQTVDNITIGIRGVTRNVTEREQALEQLKRSEMQYRNVVELSEDFIFIVDFEGNYQFLNSALKNRLGYELDNLYKMNGFELIHPDDLPSVRREIEKIMHGESVYNMQYRFRSQSGRFLTVQTNAVPLRDSKGNFNSFLGISRDITELLKKEQELHDRELSLQYANVMSMISSLLIHDDPKSQLDFMPILRTLGNSIKVDYIFVLKREPDKISNIYSIIDTWQKSHDRSIDITILEPHILEYFENLDKETPQKEIYLRLAPSDFPSPVQSVMERIHFYQMLAVPLYIKRTLYGHLLIVSTKEGYEFHPHIIKLALNVAILVGFGLQRSLSNSASSLVYNVFESINLPIFVLELLKSGKTRFLYINQHFCDYFGYTRDELMKLRKYTLLIPKSDQQFFEMEALSKDPSFNSSALYQVQLKTKEGIKAATLSVSGGNLMDKHLFYGMILEHFGDIQSGDPKNKE